jgi:hypothetical protein
VSLQLSLSFDRLRMSGWGVEAILRYFLTGTQE